MDRTLQSRFDLLKTLENGWDEDPNSLKPDWNLLELAKKLIVRLATDLPSNEVDIGAVPDGGVDIVWKREEKTFFLTLMTDGDVSVNIVPFNVSSANQILQYEFSLAGVKEADKTEFTALQLLQFFILMTNH